MDAVWSGDEQPVVGIVDAGIETESGVEGAADAGTEVGPRSIPLEDLESVLDAHDATTTRGDLESVLAAAPSLLVAPGEAALSAVARVDPAAPVLPVGDVAGVDAVERDRLPAALEAVLGDAASVRQRSILGVEVATDGSDDTSERALFDVTLVTDEPARISEYGVSSRGESVASFRADGVVVATPAGSHGYASAVDAPQLSAALDAVAVAPIAPFVTQTRRWVLPHDDVGLTVERNEGDVALVVDDRSVGTVRVGSRVTVAVDGTLSMLSIPDSELDGR